MAVVRKNLEEVLSKPASVDRQKLESTTEADIRRHASEDGQDPDASLEGFSLAIQVKPIRQRLNMTQEEFAAALHVPLATLRNWEQGRVRPDPAARALLTIVNHNPKAAFAALAEY